MFSPVVNRIIYLMKRLLKPFVPEALRSIRGNTNSLLDIEVPEFVVNSSYPSLRSATTLRQKLIHLEQQNRFLIYENMRMNQLFRELIYLNDLKRGYTGSQTKESFDYQWRELPEGEWMPSNQEFLQKADEHLLEFTQIPREWFAGKKILDAGCGSGRWTYALSKLGAHVTSFDQSAGALEEVRRIVDKDANVNIQQGDLLNLHFDDHSFDMVWSFGVAHHTENSLRVLRHLTRCVKPGGYIFVMLYAFPEGLDGFSEQSNYEEWRQRLLPKTNVEKMEIIKKHFPPSQVHGYFDALSPTINDLFTYEWMEAFFRDEGFESFYRVPTQFNHLVTAVKRA